MVAAARAAMASSKWDAAAISAALAARDRRETDGFSAVVQCQLAALEKERAWRARFGEAQRRASRLQEEKESLIRELGDRLGAAHSVESEGEQQRREIESLQSAVQRLQAECSQRQQRILDLEGRLTQAQARVQELEGRAAQQSEARESSEAAAARALQRAAAVERENAMLIERWTRLKLEEAERVNEANALYEDMLQRSTARQLQELAERQGDGVLRSSETGAEALRSVLRPRAPVRSVSGAHQGGCTRVLFLPLHGPDSAGADMVSAGQDGVIRVWGAADAPMRGPGTEEASSRLAQGPGGGAARGAGGGESPGRALADVVCKRAVRGSTAPVLDVASIPEGGRTAPGLLAASSDGRVYQWCTRNWKLQRVLEGHRDRVVAVACCRGSGAGPRLAASASADSTLCIWDLETGQAAQSFTCPGTCSSLCFAGDSSVIAGHGDGHLRQWDLRSPGAPQVVHQVAAHAGHAITWVSLAPSGQSVLTCGRDNSLKVFDVRTMELLMLARGPKGFQVASDSCAASMSPNEAYLACGGMDGSLLIWGAADGALECALRPTHGQSIMPPVVCCSWSPQGLPLVSGDISGSLVWWT